MRKLFCAAIIILMVLSLSGLSYAAEASKSCDVVNGAAGKAGRGFKNLTLGWTDVPLSMCEVTMDTKNALLGCTLGAWQGFKKAFPRTISGAVDLATFFIPDYDKSPVKPDPLMEPSTATSAPAAAATK